MPVSMTFQTIGVDLYYYQTNIDIEKIIVLSGDQNKIQPVNNNSQFLLSEFTGISCCGVWHVTCFSLECPEYKLVSIITGEDKNKTVFYSTRVNAIFSILMLNNWLV